LALQDESQNYHADELQKKHMLPLAQVGGKEYLLYSKLVKKLHLD
jgi:hypothetical protein